MRRLIFGLGLIVLGLGAWLLFGLRAPTAPSAAPPSPPTVGAPPDRANPDANVNANPNPNVNANANANANLPTTHVQPPPPGRVQDRTPEYTHARLDRARRELEHFRAVADTSRDPGEVSAAEVRQRELERQIHADEQRLEEGARD